MFARIGSALLAGALGLGGWHLASAPSHAATTNGQLQQEIQEIRGDLGLIKVEIGELGYNATQLARTVKSQGASIDSYAHEVGQLENRVDLYDGDVNQLETDLTNASNSTTQYEDCMRQAVDDGAHGFSADDQIGSFLHEALYC
jgi:methyl-accepting chemotaxis protein